MKIRSPKLVPALLACLLLGLAMLHAEVSSTGRLQVLSNDAGTARFQVELDFAATAGEQLVFFSFDVSASDASLTANGTDFSAFHFTKASPLLDGWDPIPNATFGPDSFLYTAEFETVTHPLPPQSYVLGTLSVDYDPTEAGVLDLTKLSLFGTYTLIGTEISGQPGTFQFHSVTYPVVSVIPELPPLASGLCLGVTGLLFSLFRRRRPTA